MWSSYQGENKYFLSFPFSYFNMCLTISKYSPPSPPNSKKMFIYVMLSNTQIERYPNTCQILWRHEENKVDRIFEVDHKLKCPRNLLSIGPYVHACNKEAFGVYMPQSNRWLLNGIYIHSNKIRLVKDNTTRCNVNGTDCRIKCLWKQGSRSIKS